MKILCACGCGKEREQYDKSNILRKYISGHNKTNVKEKTKLICKYCNKEYFRWPSHANRGKNNFCSSHCRAKHIGNQLKHDTAFKERQSILMKSKGNKPPYYKGENHPCWKGGISKQNRGKDYKYIQWRKDIFKKYNYTCQKCGERGGRLSSHHLVKWSDSVELRYDINNGLCLCYECHMKIHGLMPKKK